MRIINKFFLIGLTFLSINSEAAHKTSFAGSLKLALVLAVGIASASNPAEAQGMVVDMTTKEQCTLVQGHYVDSFNSLIRDFYIEKPLCGNPARAAIEAKLKKHIWVGSINTLRVDCGKKYKPASKTSNTYYLVNDCLQLQDLKENDLGVW